MYSRASHVKALANSEVLAKFTELLSELHSTTAGLASRFLINTRKFSAPSKRESFASGDSVMLIHESTLPLPIGYWAPPNNDQHDFRNGLRKHQRTIEDSPRQISSLLHLSAALLLPGLEILWRERSHEAQPAPSHIRCMQLAQAHRTR